MDGDVFGLGPGLEPLEYFPDGFELSITQCVLECHPNVMLEGLLFIGGEGVSQEREGIRGCV